MYIFEAKYDNMDTGKERVKSFYLKEQFHKDEEHAYIAAVHQAYNNKRINESLLCVSFIAH